MSVSFSALLRQKREELGLSVQGLARVTNVDGATISRIENDRIQPFLLTVVRLADSVGITMEELNQAREGTAMETFWRLSSREGLDTNLVLTEADITEFLMFFHRNPHRGRELIANLINENSQMLRARHRDADEPEVQWARDVALLLPGDVDEYLELSSFSQRQLRYPSLSTMTIRSVYQASGVLVPEDVEHYVNTISGLVAGGTVKVEELRARLAGIPIDRVKFIDVLTLNEMFGRNFYFLGIYWRTMKFQDDRMRNTDVLVRRDEVSDPKLTSLLVVAARWLYYLSTQQKSVEKYVTWLESFRQVVSNSTAEPEVLG